MPAENLSTGTFASFVCFASVALLLVLQIGKQGDREAADMSHASVSQSFKLNSGASIPTIGLGVFLAKPGSECYNTVLSALKLGYRHIDTARYYRNEADVGQAVLKSGVPREIVFLTTKLWMSDYGYSNAKKVLICVRCTNSGLQSLFTSTTREILHMEWIVRTELSCRPSTRV